MALHDFQCACGALRRDVNVPIAVGAGKAVVLCTACGVRMDWVPAIGRMDAGSGPGFKDFDCYDGRNQPVHVSSLAQLRAIEKESEQLHRNGEGQQMVWRDYSNDRSQTHKHTLMENPETPVAEVRAALNARKEKIEIRRHGQKKPKYKLGPGVKAADIGVGSP